MLKDPQHLLALALLGLGSQVYDRAILVLPQHLSNFQVGTKLRKTECEYVEVVGVALSGLQSP